MRTNADRNYAVDGVRVLNDFLTALNDKAGQQDTGHKAAGST